MRLIFFILFTFALNASAYCITNNTNNKLYFMVESYEKNKNSTFSFEQYINSNETKCCETNDKTCNPNGTDESKISFYVFTSKQSYEGCDVFGTYKSNIILNLYQDFDNCHWDSK